MEEQVARKSIEKLTESISSNLESLRRSLDHLCASLNTHQTHHHQSNGQSIASLGNTGPLRDGTLLRRKDSSKLPPISKYVSFIVSEGEIELEVLITAYILLERFLEELEVPSPVDFHKLFCVSVFIAQKLVLDMELWTAQDFAEFGGISEKELKSREIEFLNLLDFKVHVSEKEYFLYLKEFTAEESD